MPLTLTITLNHIFCLLEYFTIKDDVCRYLDQRGVSSREGPVVWPSAYGPAERDKIYKTFSLSGWAGACGHDAPMIALDALLGAGSDWEELMSRAAFHGGQWFVFLKPLQVSKGSCFRFDSLMSCVVWSTLRSVRTLRGR